MFNRVTTAGGIVLSNENGVIVSHTPLAYAAVEGNRLVSRETTEVGYANTARARAFYRRERNRQLMAPIWAFKDSDFLRHMRSR